jgi:hypothetical protein
VRLVVWAAIVGQEGESESARQKKTSHQPSVCPEAGRRYSDVGASVPGHQGNYERTGARRARH